MSSVCIDKMSSILFPCDTIALRHAVATNICNSRDELDKDAYKDVV